MKKYIAVSVMIILMVFLIVQTFDEEEIIIAESLIDYEHIYTLGIEKLINSNLYLCRKPNYILLPIEEFDKVDVEAARKILEDLSGKLEIPFYDAYEDEMKELGLGDNL